jgi:hypothetical protein
MSAQRLIAIVGVRIDSVAATSAGGRATVTGRATLRQGDGPRFRVFVAQRVDNGGRWLIDEQQLQPSGTWLYAPSRIDAGGSLSATVETHSWSAIVAALPAGWQLMAVAVADHCIDDFLATLQQRTPYAIDGTTVRARTVGVLRQIKTGGVRVSEPFATTAPTLPLLAELAVGSRTTIMPQITGVRLTLTSAIIDGTVFTRVPTPRFCVYVFVGVTSGKHGEFLFDAQQTQTCQLRTVVETQRRLVAEVVFYHHRWHVSVPAPTLPWHVTALVFDLDRKRAVDAVIARHGVCSDNDSRYRAINMRHFRFANFESTNYFHSHSATYVDEHEAWDEDMQQQQQQQSAAAMQS